MKWMVPLSCRIWIFYWLKIPRLTATFGFIALILMSADVESEEDLSPINHPEKAHTWLRFNQWNLFRIFYNCCGLHSIGRRRWLFVMRYWPLQFPQLGCSWCCWGQIGRSGLLISKLICPLSTRSPQLYPILVWAWCQCTIGTCPTSF